MAASGQGGLIFGRQSFVGIGSRDWGSVSVGRQYDFMANIGGRWACTRRPAPSLGCMPTPPMPAP
jgi:hypothetical protein